MFSHDHQYAVGVRGDVGCFRIKAARRIDENDIEALFEFAKGDRERGRFQ